MEQTEREYRAGLEKLDLLRPGFSRYAFDIRHPPDPRKDPAFAWGVLEARNPGDLREPAAQIDKAAELQKKWGTALGQIWQIGPNRLAVGDCTDEAVVTALFAGAKARLVWTDPPYGISYAAKTNI
jgi:hypothetical protein